MVGSLLDPFLCEIEAFYRRIRTAPYGLTLYRRGGVSLESQQKADLVRIINCLFVCSLQDNKQLVVFVYED